MENQSIKIMTDIGEICVQMKTELSCDAYTYTVEVKSPDHPISDHQTNSIRLADNISVPSALIWQHYQLAHRGNLVIRSGFGLLGCYGDLYQQAIAEHNLPRRPESDTEHASGCVELVKSFASHYPDLLPPNSYRRAENLMKYHDIGENQYGDRPDDGTQNKREKDYSELLGFASTAALLDPNERKVLIEDFIRFQHPLSKNFTDEERQLAQFARLIDKGETILSGLIYEKNGHGGTFRKKAHWHTISEQDKFYLQHTGGDDSLVSVWSAHFIHKYHNYQYFEQIFEVLKAAVIDVRGEWFPWYENFCAEFDIQPGKP